ncbi:hypothetical protein B0I35DRAFT_480194 [Stachybotrys elegans]|uniref:Uncharacterized protein n=1 Tax=Stachybotrys elegans TaxID=80388 RepID=A0A8K0WP79_9HYPO|nr:hypothetical protein B0I35DRAFT_480194 [Stachybotrys elegans]
MPSDTPVWFITGAGTGFGQAIAREALSRGHKVIATGRKPHTLVELESAGAKTQQFDVNAPSEVVEEKIKEAVGFYGRITHLINAAGYVLEGAIEETSDKEIYDSLNTNVIGAIRVTRAVTPYMRAQGYGFIAIFGSYFSWVGQAGCGMYNTTKWACSGLSEGLTQELKAFGITVTCVEPGGFRTAFLNKGKRITPEKSMKDVYEGTPAYEYMRMMDLDDNQQLGDVAKGATVIVDVLTQTGVAKDKPVPLRVVLGSDCVEGIRRKCRETLALLDEWEDVFVSTDIKA